MKNDFTMPEVHLRYEGSTFFLIFTTYREEEYDPVIIINTSFKHSPYSLPSLPPSPNLRKSRDSISILFIASFCCKFGTKKAIS